MTHEGTILGLGQKGEGFLRTEGKVVFVPGGLPGEVVIYDLVREGSRFDHGALVEVLEPHPSRVVTPCAHDVPMGCGGCSLLHVEREGAARMKVDGLSGLLQHAELPSELLEAPRCPGPPLQYRNHTRMFVTRDRDLAYVARDSQTAATRKKVPIKRCEVLHPRLTDLLESLKDRVRGSREIELRVGARTGERLVIFHGAGTPKTIDPAGLDAHVLLRPDKSMDLPLRGYPWIHEDVAGVRFRIGASSFFQVNTDGAEDLVRVVEELAGPARFAVDLYAGVGLFALGVFRAAERIIAIEEAPASVADLLENARGVEALTVHRSDVASRLEDLLAVREIPDVVVADPPRAGLGSRVIELLGALKAPRVILVSCLLSSLVRDLVELTRVGYSVRRIVPVDQFPGTYHLEVVVSLDLAV